MSQKELKYNFLRIHTQSERHDASAVCVHKQTLCASCVTGITWSRNHSSQQLYHNNTDAALCLECNRMCVGVLPSRGSYCLIWTSSTQSAGNHPVLPLTVPSQNPPSPILRTVGQRKKKGPESVIHGDERTRGRWHLREFERRLRTDKHTHWTVCTKKEVRRGRTTTLVGHKMLVSASLPTGLKSSPDQTFQVQRPDTCSSTCSNRTSNSSVPTDVRRRKKGKC